MQELSAIQARVLGCLVEKKETTPDQYPLSLNALVNACNQKTARDPVTAYTEGEVGHAVRELEGLGLVREVWGARVPKYEHLAAKSLDLTSKYLALLAVLMLRGPQTPGELKNHAHRLFAFDDLDDVNYALQRLIEREPPLAVALPRQPGQKEGRYAHLLCGAPSVDAPQRPQRPGPAGDSLAERVEALELALGRLERRLDRLEDSGGDEQESAT